MRISIFCLNIFLATFMLPGVASAQTVIEALIASQEPCRGLSTDAPLIGKVGVDELEEVRVPEVNIALRDDEFSMSMTGSLACKTSEDAMFAGSASARFEARMKADIATCKVSEAIVKLDKFDGEYEAVLSAFQSQMEEALTKELQSTIVDFCLNLQSTG